MFNLQPDQTLFYVPVVESEDQDQACMFIYTGLSCIVTGLMCDRRKYKRQIFGIFFFFPTEKQVSNKIFFEIFHFRTHDDHVFYASLKAV